MTNSQPWWQRAVIYQLLVPTYYDSNGDGLGDLVGVTSKLEYLQWIGVDAVWLSPIYDSPFLEMGYDPSNFVDVNPRFGTLEDFDALLEEAHRRDLRVILDWVPNHTSSEHPWFKASRSARNDPRRDWYVWQDPKPDGSPPNNWISVFGGSAWEYDEKTGQYYLHTFLEEQPDLNWWNPEVRDAVLDAMRFWLDRGVDGFRLDALDLVIEDPDYPDNPPNPEYDPEADAPDMSVVHEYTRNQPTIHEIVIEMRRLVDEYDDRVLLGELYLHIEEIATYYGEEDPELHLPLNPTFGLIPWEADELFEAIDGALTCSPEDGWPSWMLSTHDGVRVATRAGAAQAPVAAMMLMTLRGTPILYYGDEIGMEDAEIPPEKERDPQGKRIGRKRDPVRTPMQWNDWIHAGFSTADPWLPAAENFSEVNVQMQSDGPSLLNLYRALIRLRREEPALGNGSCSLVEAGDSVISYWRDSDGGRMLVALNLTGEDQTFDAGEGGGVVRLSTYLDREGEVLHDGVTLRPDEGLVISYS